MRGRMRALIKTDPAAGAQLATVDIPPLGSQDVLIKVRAASVCGTDLHIWEWDSWAQGRLHLPRRFGHELAGDVVEVGETVSQVRPGDYVSADSHIVCGYCHQCKTGLQHICSNLKILGVDADGCFSEYVAVPQSSVWKNTPTLPPEIACVQDALGNAVYATLAEGVSGKTVAVFGCGPVGLFSIGVARGSGAGPIYAVDQNEYRLGLARKMGASQLLRSDGPVVEAIMAATGGVGVEVLLEMSGSPEAISQGFQVLAKGGRFTAFGIPKEPVPQFDLANQVIFKGVRILGINGREMFRTWYQMASLLNSGALDPSPVITHTFSLEEYETAFELLRSPSKECGKVVLIP